MAVKGDTRVVRSGQAQRRGRAPIPIAVAPPTNTDTFVLRTTRPSASNTGAGTIDPYPTNHVYPTGGVLTLSGTQSLLNTIVHGRIVSNGTNLIRNCVIQGVDNPSFTGEAWLISATNSAYTTVEFCTLIPKVTNKNAYWNGIAAKNFSVLRCEIAQVIDCVSIYSKVSPYRVDVKVQGSYLHDMVQLRPDAGGNVRSMSHNDAFQLQGNIREASDVLIEGNTVEALHSETRGTIPPLYDHLAAIMVTPNVTPTNLYAGLTVIWNWLIGGRYTINIGGTNGAVVVIQNNRFQRPGSVGADPKLAVSIGISDAVSRTNISNNTYIDNGAAVPITRG